jgi:serine/threonine protein kinase
MNINGNIYSVLRWLSIVNLLLFLVAVSSIIAASILDVDDQVGKVGVDSTEQDVESVPPYILREISWKTGLYIPPDIECRMEIFSPDNSNRFISPDESTQIIIPKDMDVFEEEQETVNLGLGLDLLFDSLLKPVKRPSRPFPAIMKRFLFENSAFYSTSRSVEMEFMFMKQLEGHFLFPTPYYLLSVPPRKPSPGKKDPFAKGYLGIVMERMRGDTLSNLHMPEYDEVPRESDPIPVDEDRLRWYAFQLVSGIAFMHELRISHGDIKPQNLMFDEVEQILRIIDFGLSSDLSKGVRYDKASGSMSYYAPEVFIFEKLRRIYKGNRFSPRFSMMLDVFTIGSTLCKVFLGRDPNAPIRSSDGALASYAALLDTLGREGPTSALSHEAVSFLKSCMHFDRRIILGDSEIRSLLGVKKETGLTPDIFEPIYKDRPTAVELLQHPWFRPLILKYTAHVKFQGSDSTVEQDDKGCKEYCEPLDATDQKRAAIFAKLFF